MRLRRSVRNAAVEKWFEGAMQRIAFVMRVLPGQEDEYRRRHRVANFDALRCALATSKASQRWEAHMAGIRDQAILPGTRFHELLPEVFHLD